MTTRMGSLGKIPTTGVLVQFSKYHKVYNAVASNEKITVISRHENGCVCKCGLHLANLRMMKTKGRR